MTDTDCICGPKRSGAGQPLAAAPNPCTMHELYWTVWLAGYTAGHLAGYELCRADLDAEADAMWAEASSKVRARAGTPTHAQLVERRGYTDRGPRAGDHQGGPVEWTTGRPLRTVREAS